VADVRIRLLRGWPDLEACVRIQRDVWGHADLDITPVHNLCVSIETGAILLGAFVGRDMAGYVYSFPAVRDGVCCQHSHHLAVLPAYRGRKIGSALKRAQWIEALRRGYKLITWTCDPMQARNANLNLHALGAVGRVYFDDFYGRTPALMLDDGVPTDRLLLEWRIATPRVRARMAGVRPTPDLPRIVRAVEAKQGGEYPAIFPARPDLNRTEPRLLAELPRNIRDLKVTPGLVGGWQKAVRTAFKHYFAAGYRLDDFIAGERSFYVLKRPDSRG
jgi:predicted GNAT superfamily acetyltransferase